MSKHTLVPWRIADERDDEFVGAMVVRKDGHLVADCNVFGGESPSSDAENLANARLIAAAPDLLAALEAYQIANRIHNDSEAELFDLGETAIAKAKGES